MRRTGWKSPWCRPWASAYEMKVHGKNILYFPYDDLSEFVKSPKLAGIPFLGRGPTCWTNRPFGPTASGMIQYESGQRPRRDAGSRVAHSIATLGGDGGGGRQPVRTSDQPASILEVSGSDGAMAVRPGIRGDLQPGRWRPGSEDNDHESKRGSNAGEHRISPFRSDSRHSAR